MDDLDETESPRKKQKVSLMEADKDDDKFGVGEDSINESTLPTSLNRPSITTLVEQVQKEHEVGIIHYVSSRTGTFSGVLKKRYTDFLVNEILPNGEVLHLQNLRAPRATDTKEKGNSTQSLPQPKIFEEIPNNGSDVVGIDTGKPDATKPNAPPQAFNPKLDPGDVSTDQVVSTDVDLLKTYFDQTVVDELLGLYSRIMSSPQAKSRDLGTVKASVTSDRSIRTKIHQDIRRIFQSKIESSTDNQGFMIFSASIPNHRKPFNQPGRNGNLTYGKIGWAERGGEYLHFSIYKENKDTMEVISFLARQMKTNVKVFQFAGTKDRRGVTVQRASAHRVVVERLASQNKMLRNASIGDFEYRKHGLELGDLKGNEFTITLRDCRWDDMQSHSIGERMRHAQESVSEAMKNLHIRGFFNYYGLQRFGTFSTRTDAIGIKLLQGDFKAACDAILAFTPEALAAAQDPESVELIGSEDKARAEAIHIFKSTGRVNEVLEKLPRKYSAEANIIRHLGRFPNDYDGALRTIQRNLRLMYVHAYQSLVWNFAVGERWRFYGDKVVEGDLVMVNDHKEKVQDEASRSEQVDADGEVVIQPAGDDRAYEIDDIFERARALSAEEAASGAYSIFDVVLPLPGFDIIYPTNSMANFYESFMASEQGGGLDPHDMRRKQKDYSLSGGYRKILARIEPGYDVQVRAYADDDEQFVQTDKDRLQNGHSSAGTQETAHPPERNLTDDDKLAVILKMQLGSSQYATMALRELTKGGVTPHKPDFGGGR